MFCESICGYDWFVGISLVCGYRCGCVVGISVVVCGFRRGCVVVYGYQYGSICLISVKFCCGLISDLVRLFCFFFFVVVVVVFFFFFFFAVLICGCGWWATMEVVVAIVLVFVADVYYYFNELFILF